MAVDPELLDILVCPADHGTLTPVDLPADVCQRLVAKYRDQLGDEEPVVAAGLRCSTCGRVYPVVSDIPVMLVDEALSRQEVGD